MIILIAIVPYINPDIFYQHRLNFNEVSFLFQNEQSNRSIVMRVNIKIVQLEI